MLLDDFDYRLPDSLIAQAALDDRAASRLMVVPRESGERAHRHFHDIAEYFGPNDVIVVNRSRVMPARLFLRRASGGRVEMLFLRGLEGNDVLAWLGPIGKLKPGEILTLEESADVRLRFVKRCGVRDAILRNESTRSFEAVLEEHGHVPLPPYIRRPDEAGDRERYQTVYADERGSVAAPTAGLHFDDALLDRLRERGTEILSLVLHVGPGTFSPLENEVVEENRLSSEAIAVDARTIRAVGAAKASGKKVTAVGTTVTRTLEAAHAEGWFEAPPEDRSGETDLFIYPGYHFGVVEGLITNFHLPRSSLLLLVSALMGRERALACYEEAVAKHYRFYSYGDAMLIL